MIINSKKIVAKAKRLKDKKVVRAAAIAVAGIYVYNMTLERQGYAMIKPNGHCPEGHALFKTPYGKQYTVDYGEATE